MENIFGALVGFFVVLNMIINGVKKLAEEKEGFGLEEIKEIDKKIEQALNGQETVQEQQSEPEPLPIDDEIMPLEQVEKQEPPKKLALPESKKPAAKKETATVGKAAALFPLQESDIIKGIIMKEVLDSPRSLKPYRPPYFRS